MDQDKLKFSPLWLVIIAVLLWSTGGLFIKFTTLDAFAVNFGRAFFAVLIVGIFTHREGLKPSGFTLLSAFLYAGALGFYVYANKYTTAANAIFLQYTAPVYVLVFSPFILREKFRFTDLIAVVLCLTGMSLFFLEPPNPENHLASNMFLGNIAGLISGVCFGMYLITLRHPRSLKLNPTLSVFYGNIILALVMLPVLINDLPEVSMSDFLAVSYLGLFQIGFGYILFTRGIANGVRSLDASIIGFIEPLLNPVWVFLFLGERPGIQAVFGGLIIISAVILHIFLSKRKGR